jgi:hypothetical protein
LPYPICTSISRDNPFGALRLDFWNSFGTLQILSDRWGEDPTRPASVSELLEKCDTLNDQVLNSLGGVTSRTAEFEYPFIPGDRSAFVHK